MNSKVEVIPALEMCILTTACYKHATGCFMVPSRQYLCSEWILEYMFFFALHLHLVLHGCLYFWQTGLDFRLF